MISADKHDLINADLINIKTIIYRSGLKKYPALHLSLSLILEVIKQRDRKSFHYLIAMRLVEAKSEQHSNLKGKHP